MRQILTVAMVLVGAGCGHDREAWESPQEELAYLRSLSNPSPEQFKRRRVLERAEVSARQAEVSARQAKEANRRKAYAAILKRLEGRPEVEKITAGVLCQIAILKDSNRIIKVYPDHLTLFDTEKQERLAVQMIPDRDPDWGQLDRILGDWLR